MGRWLQAGYRGHAALEVRRSRFVATLARVDDEDAARAVIAAERAAHPSARHHCSAFVVDVGEAQPVERSSDDGEPAGTAGTPMLEVLRGAGVGNAVAVVTRYFGGILLGTGGLARAYADAVTLALADAPLVRPEVRQLLGLEVAPADAGRVQGALLGRGVDVVDAAWGATVLLTLAAPDAESVLPLVREVTQSDADLTPLGRRVVEIPEQS